VTAYKPHHSERPDESPAFRFYEGGKAADKNEQQGEMLSVLVKVTYNEAILGILKKEMICINLTFF
jgi:hypothetical protein